MGAGCTSPHLWRASCVLFRLPCARCCRRAPCRAPVPHCIFGLSFAPIQPTSRPVACVPSRRARQAMPCPTIARIAASAMHVGAGSGGFLPAGRRAAAAAATGLPTGQRRRLNMLADLSLGIRNALRGLLHEREAALAGVRHGAGQDARNARHHKPYISWEELVEKAHNSLRFAQHAKRRGLEGRALDDAFYDAFGFNLGVCTYSHLCVYVCVYVCVFVCVCVCVCYVCRRSFAISLTKYVKR